MPTYVWRLMAGALTAVGLVTAASAIATAAPIYNIVESASMTPIGGVVLPAPAGACAVDSTSAASWFCTTGATPLTLGPTSSTADTANVPRIEAPIGGTLFPTIFGIWEVDPIGRLSGNFIFGQTTMLSGIIGFLHIEADVGTVGSFDLSVDLQLELADIQDLTTSAETLLMAANVSPADFNDLFDGADNLFANILSAANCGATNCTGVSTAVRFEALPEPGTLAVFAVGLGLLCVARRRDRRPGAAASG